MSTTDTPRTADPNGDPVVLHADPLELVSPEWPRMRSRFIQKDGDAWDHYALSEWELDRAGWTDLHPHDEVNVVIEGELHVESNGETVIAGPGDTVIVKAGQTGSYWAPVYARMIGVYGPNPEGAESDYVRYWNIDTEDAR